MKYLNVKILLTASFIFCVFVCHAQRSGKVIICTEYCNDLIAGIDNHVSILALQDTALAEEQVSAFLITAWTYLGEKELIELEVVKEYGSFTIRPDTTGVVEFHIKMRNSTVVKTVNVKPLTAVCRLSQHGANSEASIPVAEFKVQRGLSAFIECCGFEASCKMLEFEIMQIGVDGKVVSTANIGGRFEENSQNLIRQAQAGDLYVFRKIYYRCPGSPKQRSEDMIFEIE